MVTASQTRSSPPGSSTTSSKDGTTSAELDRRFGARIARVVESVSDDPSLGDYNSRKRELRDRGTRAVFAADKIAKVRELTLLPASQLNEPDNRAKLAHYRASLKTLRRVDGHVPLEAQQVSGSGDVTMSCPRTVGARCDIGFSAGADADGGA